MQKEAVKHTPGPWMVDPTPNSKDQFSVCEVKDGAGILDDSYYPRRSPICYFPSMVDHKKNTYVNNADHLANARLIAAAPDLLEACEFALEYQGGLECSGTNEFGDTCGVNYTCRNCLIGHKISKAIDKAKGES